MGTTTAPPAGNRDRPARGSDELCRSNAFGCTTGLGWRAPRRRTYRAALASLVAAFSVGCGAEETLPVVPPAGGGGAAGVASRPNLIVIVADDLGYADLSVQGSPDIITPNIDSIALDGVRCTAAYVPAPQCSPSRAALLTGRYPQRFAHEQNPIAAHRERFGLAARVPTIGEALATEGYAVGMVGKWDLGEQPFAQPWNRGFADFFGFLTGSRGYGTPPADAPFAVQLTRGPTAADYVLQQGYLTDVLSDAAVQFVERSAPGPFALVVSYSAPHVPFEAPPEYEARNAHIADPERRRYAAMITAMDDGVGRVLGKLDELALREATLVAFVSDNGAPEPDSGALYQDQTAGSNAPLRGYKGELFEGGIRVPFLVRWPGRIPAGSELAEPVSTLDIAPTLLGVAGASAPAELDGVDLQPYLSGERLEAPHAALYWRFAGQRAIRLGAFKWVSLADGPEQLFDLVRDPEEQVDLAHEERQLLHELQREWTSWNEGHASPLWRDAAGIRGLFAPYGIDGMDEPLDPETGERLLTAGSYQLAIPGTERCIAVRGEAPEPGASLIEAPCSELARSSFAIETDGRGRRLVVGESNLCLTAMRDGEEAFLAQAPCNPGVTQLIRTLPADPGYLLIFEQAERCVAVGDRGPELIACALAEPFELRPLER